jgi:hypothetical protein
MYFQVPQFIDIEDKIFGPLTFKQFIYVAGGGGALFVFLKLLPDLIGLLIGLPILAFALALAFYKINSRPFIEIVQAWVSYKLGAKLYIWRKRQPEETEIKVTKKEEGVDNYIPKVSSSKLKDLSWSLDVLDKNKS